MQQEMENGDNKERQKKKRKTEGNTLEGRRKGGAQGRKKETLFRKGDIEGKATLEEEEEAE